MQIELLNPDIASKQLIPIVSSVNCGFPSPAGDYVDDRLDLNDLLIKNPSATFYAWAKGTSMKDAGIDDGDLLIIDKSVIPQNNEIAVCFIEGEFTVKRITRSEDGRLFLIPENADYKRIEIKESHNFQVWGVVINWVKFPRRRK